MSATSHVIAGKSPEDAARAALDPSKGEFLSIAVGREKYIPLGGPYRSFIRALAPRNGVPFAGFEGWVQGKFNPAARLVADYLDKKDWMGRPFIEEGFPASALSALWYSAETVAPLTLGEVSSEIRTGALEPTDVRGIAEEAGTAFAGGDIYGEHTTWDLLSELDEVGEFRVEPERLKEMEEFLDLVPRVRDRIIDEGLAEPSTDKIIEMLGAKMGKTARFIEDVKGWNKDSVKAKWRNPEWIRLILENYEELASFPAGKRLTDRNDIQRAWADLQKRRSASSATGTEER
jgi:hypothetical protein